MACKSESDLEIFETEFAGRIIDLRRFAYDFFVFSAKTFGIPGSCIYKWIDTDNHYVWSNFISVISRLVFRYQIEQRLKWREIFASYYEEDKLESFNGVSDLWVKIVVHTIKNNYIRTFFNEVEILLALTNELIQFLYSKNCELYLEDLAKLWFDWISVEKRTFEKDGGIKEMYQKGQKPFFQLMGDFYPKFIKKHYIPYENFAGDETIKNRMNELLDEYQKIWGPGSEKYENKMDDPTREIYLPFNWFETNESVATLRRDKASGNESSGYAASETVPRRELLRLIRSTAVSDATRSQSLYVEYLGEPTRRRTRSSDAHRRRNINYGSYATKEQVLNQMSLQSGRAERSRKPSHVAALFQNLTRGNPKDTARHPKGSSGKQRKQNCKDSSGPNKEQALQKVSLQSGGTERSSENKGTFCTAFFHTLSPSISTDTARNRKSSGEQKRLDGEDGSCPIVEQAVEQTGLDSLAAKQSSDNEPSISGQPSKHLARTIPVKPARHRKGSSGLPKGLCILCPWVEPAPGQLSDYSEGKEARENKPSVSETSDATSSQNLADGIPKNSAKDLHGSSGEQKSQNCKNISCPGGEQAFEMVIVDSSQEKESGEDKPSVSEIYDATPSQDQIGTIPKVPMRHRRSSGKQKRPNKCSSSQSVELNPLQMSLVSSDGKLSNENKPDVSEAHGETPF